MQQDNGIKVIIDTDPGTDDALALAVASAFLPDRTALLVSSYGNVMGDKTYYNLRNLAHLLGFDIPVIRGSDYPIYKKTFTPTDFHHENGLGGVILPEAPSLTAVADGCFADRLAEIYRLISENKNVIYVILGPMTNVAKLVKAYPDVTEYIDEVVVMGGGFNVVNSPGGTEYNFWSDPESVRIMLESNLRLTVAPLDMTIELAFGLNEIEEIVGLPREELSSDDHSFDLLAKIFYKNYESAIVHGEPGSMIHDATTIAYLINNEKCRVKTENIVIDTFGAVSRKNDGCTVNVIESFDKSFIAELLSKSFIHYRNGKRL